MTVLRCMLSIDIVVRGLLARDTVVDEEFVACSLGREEVRRDAVSVLCARDKDMDDTFVVLRHLVRRDAHMEMAGICASGESDIS